MAELAKGGTSSVAATASAVTHPRASAGGRRSGPRTGQDETTRSRASASGIIGRRPASALPTAPESSEEQHDRQRHDERPGAPQDRAPGGVEQVDRRPL